MNDHFFTDNYALENKEIFESTIPQGYRDKTREQLPDFSNQDNLLNNNMSLNSAPGTQGEEYRNSNNSSSLLDDQFKHELITTEIVNKDIGDIDEIKNHVPYNLFQEFKKKMISKIV